MRGQLLLVLGVLVGLAPRGAGPAAESRYEILVLGTVQDGGLPHLGCERDCCTEARRTGESLYPASLGIHDARTGALILIEATPAIEAQIATLHTLTGQSGLNRRPVDALLLTHAHMGHYTGLAQFGREVASTDGIQVHASPRMGRFLETNGPWSLLVDLEQIRILPFELSVEFELAPGLHVTPIPVPHRDEFTDTMAFRIRGPERTVLFVPDIDNWDKHKGLLEQLMEGVDVAYLDGTFYDGRELPDRDLGEIPHPMMVDTMHRLRGQAEDAPGSIRFIHMNHTNPVLHEEPLRRELESNGFRLAQRGERVPL